MTWRRDTDTNRGCDGGWVVIQNHESLLRTVQFARNEDDLPERLINLKGPTSPLEVIVQPLTQLNKRRSRNHVRLTKDSINYVLLDQQPEIECRFILI